MKELLYHDKNKNGQRVKIQGTEHKWREQKQQPKLRINPFENWKKKNERKAPTAPR